MDKCRACGAPLEDGKCSYCGTTAYSAPTAPPSPASQTTQTVSQVQYVNAFTSPTPTATTSDRNKWVAFLLCLFVGVLGLHRFYTGKIGTGLLYLFTVGLGGIGVLVDLVVLLMGNFQDKQGRYLR